MTILTSDLVFFAASFQTDEPSGGGLPSGLAVQDGVENNLFPDVGPGDRDLGRVQLRKFYPSVVSANTDALLTAQCLVSEPPEDPAVGVVLFRFGNEKTTRAEAAAALQVRAYQQASSAATFNRIGLTPGENTINSSFAGMDVSEGQLLEFYRDVTSAGAVPPITFIGVDPRGQFIIQSVDGEAPSGISGVTVTLNALPPSDAQWVTLVVPNASGVLPIGCAIASAVSGADSVDIDKTQFQLIPAAGAYPSMFNGLSPAELRRSNGQISIFRPGEAVLIQDSTNVETAVIESVDHRGTLHFTQPLENEYEIGARVSSMLTLGDLKATAGPGFSQQTWTRTFSDALIGTPAAGSYNRSIFPFVLTNESAVTERWAIVFTGADSFQLIGEARGLVAFGSRFDPFEPNNPQVNLPFFTIQPEGWSEGWSTGNVYRFNTTGASAPVWAARTTSPSEPGSLVSAVIKLRGGVDA